MSEALLLKREPAVAAENEKLLHQSSLLTLVVWQLSKMLFRRESRGSEVEYVIKNSLTSCSWKAGLEDLASVLLDHLQHFLTKIKIAPAKSTICAQTPMTWNQRWCNRRRCRIKRRGSCTCNFFQTAKDSFMLLLYLQAPVRNVALAVSSRRQQRRRS